MKEIEEDINIWKNILCLWIERINIVKTSILSKAICRSDAIPNKILIAFSTEIEKTILKFVWNSCVSCIVSRFFTCWAIRRAHMEQQKIPKSQSSLEKKKEILSSMTTWMNLECIMLRNVREKKTNTVWSHIYVEFFKKTTTKTSKTKLIDMENRSVVARGKEWKIGENSEWVKRYRLPVIK